MGKTKRSDIVIRAALPEDGEAIYEIGSLCFSDPWRKETVTNDLSASHSRYYVADCEGEIVGYACFWFVADEAQLVNIGVLPAFRRRGIGEKLLETGMESAVSQGMTSLFLEVRVSNIEAQRLYRRHGLAVTALRKGVYESPSEDGYIMAKALCKENI